MVSGETTIMEHMKPMGPLKMDGNVAENWRKWRQRWNLYAKASGDDEKDEEIQCAIFLHTIGDEALEIYDTFTFTETEQDKSSRSFRNLRATVHQGKTQHTSDIYLIRVYKTEENSMHLYLTFATKQRPVNLNHYRTA